ncbi:MAG: 4Fe-4S dicluster domain-containing protein [bacterium]|nr:4Fe-4S dicluster domain-containing protein [bacterium]
MENFLQLMFWLTGLSICLLLLWMAISSRHEKQPRAVIISLLLLVCTAATWFGFYSLFHDTLILLMAPTALLLLVGLLFFAPLGRRTELRTGDITSRVDERDVMFAREEYEPGTDKYDAYYAMRPQLKAVDDKIRRLPPLLKPGGRFYDADVSEKVTAIFEEIKGLTTRVDGDVASEQASVDPANMTAEIKERLRAGGAAEVGVARLNPMYVYSHVGRGPEPWGEPIVNSHRFAVVFTLEMDYDKVHQAPRLPTVEESAERYLAGARLSIDLADHIRQMGYPARAHISDSNYQIMLPPVAVDAGLGELGRLGYLISPRHGARIRLGAVTTDLPLLSDRPISFGVRDFCERCLKCAVNCPSAAIPGDGPVDVRGAEKWPTNVEQCVRYWRVVGSDCGLCMKVCPYSHPPTFLHNLVRAGISRSAFARTIAVWADDLFYGRKLPVDHI